MSYTTCLIVIVIAEIFVVNAFLTQRAALELEREGMGYKEDMLPDWFGIVWIPRLVLWGALIYVLLYHSITTVVAYYIIDFLITVFIPIPKSRYVNALRIQFERRGW